MEGLDELTRLVVVPRPRHLPVHLLEADQVGILVLDDLDDPLEAITPVSPADAFMDVVAEKSHDRRSVALFRPR